MKMRIGIFSVLLTLGSAQAKNACSICRQYNPSKSSIILKLNNSEVEKLSNLILESLQYGQEPTKMATDLELYKASISSLCSYIRKECSKNNVHLTDKERHTFIDECLSQFVKGKTVTLDRNNNPLFKWTKYAAIISLPIISIFLHKKAEEHGLYSTARTNIRKARQTIESLYKSEDNLSKTDENTSPKTMLPTDSVDAIKDAEVVVSVDTVYSDAVDDETIDTIKDAKTLSDSKEVPIVQPIPTRSAFQKLGATVDNPSDKKVADNGAAPTADSGAGISSPREKESKYIIHVKSKPNQQPEKPDSPELSDIGDER